MTAAKWTLYLLIALSGTIAQREIHELWTPHKVRNLVWTSRGDGKHYRRAVRDVEKVHRELLRFFQEARLDVYQRGRHNTDTRARLHRPGCFSMKEESL